MTKKRTTKRSLLLSGLSLLMCVSMFIGSTFAWFTDSVTSAGNKIKAGTLDIQLLMNADGSEYKDISDSTSPIFGAGSIAQNNNAETLWEPGKTQVAYLAIKNNGNLALTYKVALDVENVAKDLYKVMEYAIVPNAQYGSVDSWTSGNSVEVGTQSVSGDISLTVGTTHYFALAIHMDEEVGNEYQNGEVNFDLTILATQDTVESDSFNNQYDKDAEYPTLNTKVSTANELATALASGEDMPIALANDIDGFSGTANSPTTIDLNKNTLNNSNTFTVKDDFSMSNGVVAMDGTFGYVDVRPNDESVYAFNGVKFVNEYRRKPNSNTGSDRIEAMVKHTASKDAKITFVFENCVFENAQATFSGLSGVKGEVDITFKNCTFNAMMGSDPVINIGSNLTGTVNIDHCTFNITGTYANVSVIDVSNSSNTTVTVNATNNTLNANKAVPYTYDPAKGETEADSVKIGNVTSVRNYCIFDLRLLPGGYSTIHETGTILQGEIAVPSLHN